MTCSRPVSSGFSSGCDSLSSFPCLCDRDRLGGRAGVCRRPLCWGSSGISLVAVTVILEGDVPRVRAVTMMDRRGAGLVTWLRCAVRLSAVWSCFPPPSALLGGNPQPRGGGHAPAARGRVSTNTICDGFAQIGLFSPFYVSIQSLIYITMNSWRFISDFGCSPRSLLRDAQMVPALTLGALAGALCPLTCSHHAAPLSLLPFFLPPFLLSSFKECPLYVSFTLPPSEIS